MDYITDTSRIDTDVVQKNIEASELAQQEDKKEQEYFHGIKTQKEQEQQAQAEKDNKNNVGQELGNAIAGGLADAGSDILTLPERAIDMASGEMQEQGADYKPDWDPLNPDQFETQTWWGGLIRGTVNLGTLLIPVGGAFKAVGALSKLPTIAKGAAIGASVDLITAQSQEENLSGMIVKHFPVMDNVLGPLATKESDHPLMKTLKNVVEGMGIGAAFDVILLGRQMKKTGDELAEGLGKAADEVEARNKSVEDQTVEAGREELKSEGFGEHKNKPMAEPQQGSPNSTGKPMDVMEQLNTIREDPTAARGSTDSLLTPTEARRLKVGGDKEVTKLLMKKAKEILSDDRYEAMLAESKKQGTTFTERFRDSVLKAHEAIQPRNSDMSAEELYESLFPKEYRARTGVRTYTNADGKQVPIGKEFDLDYIPTEEILAADLIVGAFTKQLRDLAQVSGEMISFRDLQNGTGPMKTLADRVVVGMAMTRRSRYLAGLNLQKLAGPAGKKARQAAKKSLEELHNDSAQAMDMVMRMIKKDDSQKFVGAWIETLSNMKDVNTLEDLDKFMRRIHTGGEINGKKRTGELIRELQSLSINGILSGPKTPVKALTGTGLNASFRYLSQSLGAVLRMPFTGDSATARASVASLGATFQALPEAMKVFSTRFKSNWSGDYTKLGNKFMEYQRRNEDFQRLERWVETRGTDGDKAAFRFTSMVKGMNMNPVLTLNSNLMNATDAAFDVVMGRARAREFAVRKVLDEKGVKAFDDPKALKEIEDNFYKDLYESDGTIKEDFLKKAAAESKLNEDLTGLGKKMEDLFNSVPAIKPFFLFARTGVNGIAMTTKYTPGLNVLLKKQRAIMMASADNLDDVIGYGIKTAEDLANEKALIVGRQTIGTSIGFAAYQLYLSDRLRGNGPENRQLRSSWVDAGWTPRSIKIGDAWVSLDAFEPFNSMLYAIADIGDNSELMGPEWVEQSTLRVVTQAAIGLGTKSYTEGLIQLVDLIQGESGQGEKIIGQLVNNQVPMSGLRNEIGKLFNPGMNEINRSIVETIRARNGITETIAIDGGLPKKYDLLTGEIIKDWHPITRLFNMVSPVHFNVDQTSPGRDLLFNSNYDTQLSVQSSPNGESLVASPVVRSMFQQAIGKQNLEKKLDAISRRKDVQDSVKKMNEDLAKGKRDIDPKDYLHNRLIKQEFNKARKKAWAEISSRPEVQEISEEKRQANIQQVDVKNRTSSMQDVLSIYK